MTQEISMKIIFPSCVLNCQFHMYVNLSACTTVISGWVVVVSSFRDGLCVCARCVHMCEHIKCSPVFLGVSSWGRRLQTVVSPFLLVWFSSSILSPPIYIFCFVTYIPADLWCLVGFDFSPPSLAMLQEFFFSLVFLLLFTRSVVRTLCYPHEPQHTRLPCPSLSPGVCSNFCPLNWWCHPTISSSTALFFCLRFFPASGCFPVSWLFISGGQSIKGSASVLPVNIQGWLPLGLTGLVSFNC